MDSSTELLALAFTNETQADEVLKTIQQLINEGRLSILDMAVLIKHQDGRTMMKDNQDVGPISGTLFGAMVGGLIGAVTGPVGVVLGAMAGATVGGVAARALDFGFPDEYLRALRANLKPGSSALIILTRPAWSDRIIEAVTQFKGRIIRHVLKEDIGAYLAAIGLVDDEQTSPAELAIKLEARIAGWQTEIETLNAKMSLCGTTEIHAQLVNLRTKQRLAQETLHQLWLTEIEELNRQIELLRARVETAGAEEAGMEIVGHLKAIRARRQTVRAKLYTQLEARIQSWQGEIEELRTRLANIQLETQTPLNPRLVALQRFASTFDDPVLPTAEAETQARLAMLQAETEAATMELQNLYKTQIATWQATIADLQAYQAIPGGADKSEIVDRIAELQAQVAAVQAKL